MNDDVIQEKIQLLVEGHRLVVSDEFLEAILDMPISSRVASCINRRAVGTKDKYVAWIGEESRPKDITYVMSSGNMLAIGSP